MKTFQFFCLFFLFDKTVCQQRDTTILHFLVYADGSNLLFLKNSFPPTSSRSNFSSKEFNVDIYSGQMAIIQRLGYIDDISSRLFQFLYKFAT